MARKLRPGKSVTVETDRTFHCPPGERALIVTVNSDGVIFIRPKGLRGDNEVFTSAHSIWNRLLIARAQEKTK